MAPTAVRAIKQHDFNGELIKKFNTKSLQTFAVAGERCDPDTINWIHKHFPNVIINDNWWQTETGWPIAGNLCNLRYFKSVFPTVQGSATVPVPGNDIKIFD